MQLEPHVEALRGELASLGTLGDEHVAAAAERLSQALGSTLGLRLLEILSEAALEVSSQLPAGHVEVRLAGQEPSLVYLRLPDSLKASIEDAASREGVSVNTWIVKALARGLSSATTSRIGSRLTGYGRS